MYTVRVTFPIEEKRNPLFYEFQDKPQKGDIVEIEGKTYQIIFKGHLYEENSGRMANSISLGAIK